MKNRAERRHQDVVHKIHDKEVEHIKDVKTHEDESTLADKTARKRVPTVQELKEEDRLKDELEEV